MTNPDATGEPIRVLVVDDDFMVARIHRRYVASTPGFEVVAEAHTAAAAETLITDTRPDLVLLDLYLPDIGVEELLIRMLAPEQSADVIVLSAANDIDIVRRAFHGGAQQYLIKPFSREDLAARLGEYRRRRQSVARAVRQDGTVGQSAVDAIFGRATPVRRPQAALPKGLAEPTLRLVVEALQTAAGIHDGTISASECGERVGLARVSARRYLEYLVRTGTASVEHQYGGSGRPVRRYRVTPG